MPSKKQTAKGNKPTASVDGIHTSDETPARPLAAHDVMDYEFEALGYAAEDDGVRIMSRSDDELPEDAPENAFDFKEGSRLLDAKTLLQYIRSEQWTGQVFYDVYRITPDGDALWRQVRDLFRQQERSTLFLDAVHDGDAEKAAELAGKLIAGMKDKSPALEATSTVKPFSEMSFYERVATLENLSGDQLNDLLKMIENAERETIQEKIETQRSERFASLSPAARIRLDMFLDAETNPLCEDRSIPDWAMDIAESVVDTLMGEVELRDTIFAMEVAQNPHKWLSAVIGWEIKKSVTYFSDWELGHLREFIGKLEADDTDNSEPMAETV